MEGHESSDIDESSERGRNIERDDERDSQEPREQRKRDEREEKLV